MLLTKQIVHTDLITQPIWCFPPFIFWFSVSQTEVKRDFKRWSLIKSLTKFNSGNFCADIIDHMKGFDYKDHWSKLCQHGFPDSQARVSKIGITYELDGRNRHMNSSVELEMKFIKSSNSYSKRRCSSAFPWGYFLRKIILILM